MKNKLILKALDIADKADIGKAYLLQKNLSRFIKKEGPLKDARYIAGVDISYTSQEAFCSIVLIDAHSKEKNIVEEAFSVKIISFPYIPGLLFYREFPVFFDCYKKLKIRPELLIFDGHGLSHQRMMVIATMSGILLNKPSIGCAKSHLFGEYKIPGDKKFSRSELKVHETVVGYVLRSKENVKPIFVSTGFAVSPLTALEIVKSLVTSYKLPLPTHYAHLKSEKFKITILNERGR
jgi:deoxyribonuclease V